MPFFSIIIPTYNRAHMLSKALESVHVQTFNDWECIVVDDGSSDNTKELLQHWIDKDNRFRYIYQENAERSAARNNGINNATGKYFCFLDSDDYFLSDRLSKLKDFITEINFPEALIYTGIIFKNGIEELKREVVLFNPNLENIFDYLTLTIIGTPQICAAKEVLSIFKFNANLKIGEDLELCFRVAHKFPIIPQKDNISVVAIEHDNRSVANLKSNTSKEQIKTLKLIFNKDHSGKKISWKKRNRLLSLVYFNVAKFYMANNKKLCASFEIFKSILIDPFYSQNKHRLYCLLSLFVFNVPKEYKNY